jgi:hypothetical protein
MRESNQATSFKKFFEPLFMEEEMAVNGKQWMTFHGNATAWHRWSCLRSIASFLIPGLFAF